MIIKQLLKPFLFEGEMILLFGSIKPASKSSPNSSWDNESTWILQCWAFLQISCHNGSIWFLQCCAFLHISCSPTVPDYDQNSLFGMVYKKVPKLHNEKKSKTSSTSLAHQQSKSPGPFFLDQNSLLVLYIKKFQKFHFLYYKKSQERGALNRNSVLMMWPSSVAI